MKHEELGELEYQAIGRVVRACAEIEELITMFIAEQARITDGTVAILLGQTALSKKLSIANYLAAARGPEIRAQYENCITPMFKEIIQCRNAVVHGQLLGKSEDGHWAFLSVRTEEPAEVGKSVQLVFSFSRADLVLYADEAKKAVELIEKSLEYEGLRILRRGRSLEPHRKSQPKAKPAAKRKRPPRSSRVKSPHPKGR
ncbi:hypothetical protein [Sphingomonas sp. URHD0057]|uniref:hypothetical protein n=1 Tax=Sphingomonas sp. URHD0057 TaxID=1380389 RepID=UPI0012DC1B98|nr:hypothetical protein [Sphingomonas sp. URHD0057]